MGDRETDLLIHDNSLLRSCQSTSIMPSSIVPSDVIRFCALCKKPIATESAYKRHISYCRRNKDRPRRRPRSCKGCHSAKAKCSFELECSRCKSKGLRCVYESLIVHNTQTVTTVGHHDEGGSGLTIGGSQSMPIPNSSSACSSIPSNFGSSADLMSSPSSPRSVVDLQADPVAQHTARFILESMRGLPLTMTSRETFSWLSHGYWHQPELPQNIARCLEIASLYIKNKPSVHDAFWSTVDQENRQLLRNLPNYSPNEVISGVQAQMVYMVMFALNNQVKRGLPEVRLQMLMTFELYGKKSSEIDKNGWPSIDELDNPNVTWEAWIYAEARRRSALTWFLLSRVMDLKFGVLCSSVINCRQLPLPSPGSVWNARTRAEWEACRNMWRRVGNTSLRTFGDLIEARSCPPDSEQGQELNRWYASCDKLGLLLTLATTMV
ncbi:hypothetical protein F4677DRAFT_241831 [Hypoxylon crocopeplum]|nr:hypothetical protein F4677DRAFT_241831 [Hypoxylon crocopeplum]